MRRKYQHLIKIRDFFFCYRQVINQRIHLSIKWCWVFSLSFERSSHGSGIRVSIRLHTAHIRIRNRVFAFIMNWLAGCFNFLKVKEVCSSRGKSLHVTVVITNWFRSDRPQRVELILSFALNSNVKFHFVTVLRFTVLLHFPESI